MNKPSEPNFSSETLVVFVGHSDDALEEARAIVGLQAELQSEIEKRLEVMANSARFTKVKIWEWRSDAKAVVGGQEAAIKPFLKHANVAIFVFKTRVGEVTWSELNEFRDRVENPCPVIALFPASPPSLQQMTEVEAVKQWLDLLKKKEELTSDWAKKEGSRAITPVEGFRDSNHLLSIVREQFGRFLSGLLKAESVSGKMPVPGPDIRSEMELRFAYETTAKLRHPCDGVDLDDLDWPLVEDFRSKELGGDAGKELAREILLSKLGLFSPLAASRKLHYAAVLCFCDRPHRFIPSASSDFITGDATAPAFQAIPVEGPLSRQIQQLVVLTKERLPKISTIGGDGLRKEDTEIPLRVFREAISNAVAHRDYHLPGTIQVRVLENCLEIQNPGRFPSDASWEVFLKANLVSRPSDMAVVLYLKKLDAVERLGRGFAVFREYIQRHGAESIIWEVPTPNTVLVRIKRFATELDVMKFQAFLAFGNRDRSSARELKRLLTGSNVTVWYEDDEVRPNLTREQLIRDALNRSGAILVLVGKDGLNAYEDDVMRAAVNDSIERGRIVIPVLLPGAPLMSDLPTSLRSRSAVDLSAGLSDDTMIRLIGRIRVRQASEIQSTPTLTVPTEGPNRMANVDKAWLGGEKGAPSSDRPHTPFPYDVFVSYSSRDQAWVRGELLKRIEQAGLKAFIDFRDFTPGLPSIKECERGVVQSCKTLVILTPNYVDREWGAMENVMAQTLSPANRDLRLIPLLKAACDKPLRIAALTHIDFTDGADLVLAWRQLLTALGAAPELPPPKEPGRPTWHLAHPYPMPPNFTGRVSERGTLTRWLDEDATPPLLVLRALGGFGKSALAWHWLTHDVDATKWPRVVWWSFYEGDASFDHFVLETLAYLHGEPAMAQPLSAREALVALLTALRQPGTLLVLDGFERVLRAFSGLEAAYQGDEARPADHDRDCVSPLAENFLYNLALQPQLRSKVVLTTRLTPRILEARGGDHLQGCREVPLLQMQPEDAVAFFHAQGIRGTHTEIELACEPYGYHPLSLRLLAGLIIGDLWQPGDITAAKRLDVSGDLVQRQHHVLEQAFDCLAPAQRKLLGAIACFRWPVSYETLQAATESTDTLDYDLRDLISRGLLHHEAQERRFDLHPIVRHYAYERLAAPERVATHTRLRDYFAAVPEAARVTCLEDLAPVIELYHHTVRTGRFDEAQTLYRDRLSKPLYYQLGAYTLIVDLLRALFPDGEDRPPRLRDESAQAWALNALANAYSRSGQPHRAGPLLEASRDIDERRGDKRLLAVSLENVADAQRKIGALRAAEATLRRGIALCREIENEFNEAIGHRELGSLLAFRSEDTASETELATSQRMLEQQTEIQAQGIGWAYRASCELLRLRAKGRPKGEPGKACQSAIAFARRALELADEHARTDSPVERDYVRAHWLLGAAHRVAGQNDEAERHLHEALERCRRINMVDTEADILIDLARLRAATGSMDEAQRLAGEARVIAERSGYVMPGADAHLELAKLAAARGDQPLARDHAQKAKELATCDGPPDYTYKAAYDEACGLLQQIA